jgi:shikimate dehydrogenase
MKTASVIGWPIKHSRSPLIHKFWLEKHGIEGDYTRQAVPPEELGNFITALREGVRIGTNVTIPHKEKALAFVDEADDRVRRTGSLNTIWREAGRLCATSTDGQGFVANFQKTLPHHDLTLGPVFILGAGGSARAIVDELIRQGVSRIFVFNRTMSRAEQLVSHFGSILKSVSAADVPAHFVETATLINTTAAGLQGETEMALPWQILHPKAAVADIVYTPLTTPFLQSAKNHGHPIVPGLGMLLHQAVIGFEKWFGVRPEVTQELHDLVARDVERDQVP